MSRHDRSADEIIIEPAGNYSEYLRDLWLYRELFVILAWRDILVRYKQTAIGIAWAVIQPLLTMAIFTAVFGRIAKLPSSNLPYHILVFAGLLPWQLFSQSLTGAANSLVSQSNLISKVYFPRMIVPAAAIVTSLVDFLISAVLLAAFMAWDGILPTSRILALPLFIALAFAAAFGASLWFSALTVRYRDFRFVVPFVLQLGLYLSPVGFSSAVVPEKWKFVYALNPMVSIIDGFRWALLPSAGSFDPSALLISTVVIVLINWSGVRYFLATEATFADVV